MVSTFINDTFTEGSNTALQSHSPDTGGAWAKQSGFAGGMTVNATTDNVAGDSSGTTSVYRNEQTLSDQDVDIVATVNRSATSGLPGLIARAAEAAGTFYWFYIASTSATLQKIVGGSSVWTVSITGFSPSLATDYEMMLRIRGNTISCYVDGILYANYTDSSSPLTSGYAGIMGRSTATIDNFSVKEIGYHDRAVEADAMWTWFNSPRVIYDDGEYHFGSMLSNGAVKATVADTSDLSVETFELSNPFEVDDHDNAVPLTLPSGKKVYFYSKHNDTTGTRYRIQTTAGDYSAWDTEENLGAEQGAANVTYANPFYLSDASKVVLLYRSGTPSVDATLGMLTASADLSTWDSEIEICEGPTPADHTPYFRYIQNGNGRIDVLCTDLHPNEGGSSVYHFYIEWDSGSSSFKYYKSDGTEITTAVTWDIATEATLIYDGSSARAWIWDIQIDGDGYPRVIYSTFPNTATDHRYHFSRWNGSSWTTGVQIAAAGGRLYAGETYYSGGACFDGNDPNVVYLSIEDTKHEMSVWESDDEGATWSKTADITTGSWNTQMRPFSPRGHDGKFACCWISASYTSYTVWGASAFNRFEKVTTAPGGDDHTLAPADATSAATIEVAALTQNHVLAAADATSATTVDAAALTQNHVLASADMASATAIDAAALTQNHVLAPADMASGTTIDSPTVTENGDDHTLAPADATAATTIDAATLTQNHVLAPADAIASSTIEIPSLAQNHVLTAAEVAAASSIELPALTQNHGLTAGDIYAVPEIASPTLSQFTPGAFVAAAAKRTEQFSSTRTTVFRAGRTTEF